MTTHQHPNQPLHATALPPGHAHLVPLKLAHTATHLLAGQTQVIHASKGLTLHVLLGRLWLTQTGDPADRFLCAGDTIELAQDWVVVEADPVRRDRPVLAEHATAYRLVPYSPLMGTAQVASRPLLPAWRNLFGSGRRLGFSWA